jgi:hypothetical protein
MVPAGLLVRTFVSLLRVDPGFARHAVLLVLVDGKEPVDDPAQRLQVYAACAMPCNRCQASRTRRSPK